MTLICYIYIYERYISILLLTFGISLPTFVRSRSACLIDDALKTHHDGDGLRSDMLNGTHEW